MVLDTSAIESLVKNNSKYNPNLFEVRQALVYLRVNGIDPGKITDYQTLLEIITDWQSIDLKYEKTIIGEIDRITKDGVVPDKYTLDGLIASYEKYLKSKPARIKLRSRVYELAAKSISSKVVTKFKKDVVDEAVDKISKKNPDIRKEEIEIEKKRVEEKVNKQLDGGQTTKKTEEVVVEEKVAYKEDVNKIKESFTKAKDVESWAKENNLKEELTKKDVEELEKGFNTSRETRARVDELREEIKDNATNVVNKVEKKLETSLSTETKKELIEEIKITSDVGQVLSKFEERIPIPKSNKEAIEEIVKKEYKTKDKFIGSAKEIKDNGISQEKIYEVAMGEIVDEKITPEVDVIDPRAIEIIDKVIIEKEIKINETCNKLLDEYFDKNTDKVDNELFKKELTDFIGKNKEASDFYKKNTTEVDDYVALKIRKIKDEQYIAQRMEEIFPEGQSDKGSVQDKITELKTEEFIKNNPQIVATHQWYATNNEITKIVADANPSIKPYLENQKLGFSTNMPKEEMQLKQKQLLASESYSNFVSNTYNPNNLISDWGGSKNWIKKYEMHKAGMIKNGLKISYDNDKIANLDKFYELLKSSPRVRSQINGARYLSDLYQRLDLVTFHGMSRMGMAQKFVNLSTRLFGETGGNFTRMWLNNFIKGGAKSTIEQGFAQFLKSAGGQLLKGGAETAIKGVLSTAAKTATTAVAKTALGGVLKGAVAAIGGAATGGIVTAVMAGIELLSKLKKPIDKLLKSIGLDPNGLKKWIKKTLGIGPGILLGAAAAVGGFVVALPAALMAAATAIMATVGPIVGIVLAGLFIYQMFISQQVSSLVPPKKYAGVADSTAPVTGKACYVTRDGVKIAIIPINGKDICGTNIDKQVCDKKSEIMTYVGDSFCSTNKNLCYLESHVYEMYLKMINAATDDLKKYDLLMVDYGYRDFAGQVEMWNTYCSNKHEDSCPSSGCTPKDTTIAACPGTSIHQTGRAIDFKFGLKNGGEYLRWLNENAHKYGFEKTVSGEPWHWEYTAKLLPGEEGKEECEGD